MALSPQLTRIKNNQITDNTIVASSKIVPGTVTGGLLSDPLNYLGNVSITGNLSVAGTTTTVDTTNTAAADPLILLNRSAVGTNTSDMGIVMERGALINVAMYYDETNDQFAFVTTTETGTTAGSINVTSYADVKTGNLIVANTSTFGNVRISTNDIITTNSNGNLNLTPNGTGLVIASNLSVTSLTNGRLALVGADDQLVDDAGITYSGNSIVVGGNITANGGYFYTTAATYNFLTANATTINIGPSGGNVAVGGDIILGGNDIRESGGNVAITLSNQDVTVAGDLAVNGGDITTSQTTATVFNANATTLSIGNAATTLYIGSTSGTVTVNGDLKITGNDILSSTGNTAITLSDQDVTVRGNLLVQGATTTVGSNDLTVNDSIINLHTFANLAPLTVDDGRDIGLLMHYYKSSNKYAFLGWANDTGYLEYYSDGTETGGVFSGQYGTIKANLYLSEVPTGTAPFTVQSTTQVANLNVQTAGNLINGNSNVIVDANSNVHVSVAGNANILSVTGTGANISGTANVTGNIDAGANINTTASTINLANATTTTVNFAGAATAINMGIATGQTTLLGNLSVSNNFVVTANANLANLRVVDNTVSSTVTNANINIDPNGTGSVVLNSSGDNSNVVINGNTASGYANLAYFDSLNGRVGILTNTIPTGVALKVNANSSVMLPVGNVAERPTGIEGMLRYNTTSQTYEMYNGTAWKSFTNDFTIITTDTLTGDDSTTVFTLSQSTTTVGVIITINGVVQQPTTAYSVSGTTLTFTEAPSAGDSIDARIITTTTVLKELAENDSAVTVTDTGSNGTVKLTTDGSAKLTVNSYIYANTAIVSAATGTTVNLSAVTIDSFDKTLFRSARYVVQASHASAGYEVSQVLVVHNGTASNLSQTGTTYTGAGTLGTVSTTISGSDVLLRYTASNTSTTVKIFKEYMPI